MFWLSWLLLLANPGACQALAEEQRWLQKGRALYYEGDLVKSLAAYERAAQISSMTVQPWLNGAVVLEELGERKKAAVWYGRAAALTTDPFVFNALGWAQWRAADLQAASTSFARALLRQPDNPYALMGAGRVELDQSRPKEALKLLQRAAAAAPLLNVAFFYQGKAYEALNEPEKAVEAYKASVIADSYFTEGRDALGRAYLRQRNYNDAWRQFSKILDLEPKNKKFLAMLERVQPMLTRRPSQIRPTGLFLPIPYLADSEPGNLVPLLRVGIGTNPMGKPKPRPSLVFKVTCAFDALDAESGRRIISGEANESWQLRLQKVKKKPHVALVDSAGKTIALRRLGFVIRPQAAATGIVALDPATGASGGAAGKLLRGRLEVTLFKGKLKLVNIIDLENYTHGVVAAEMPIKSPLEALKAQAVVARSHALFIKKVTRRHRREGFDVCDDQHCQVYAGARVESQRSREIVEATRGRIVTYQGQVAHVIYSSNCGGHTQSGRDLTGWGDVPYWLGIADSPPAPAEARSPWELRQWLAGWPQAFCKPSADVHASHFRWTRLIAFKDLEEKLGRKLHVGKLKALRAMRRSPSGNVNLLLVQGTAKSAKIDSELRIRGLLGLGSLRSTQFVIDLEYGPDGKPQTYVFRGGGWGHGVGLCQSGAMGRADAGQTYDQIIKAYFKGTELGQAQY